jgi:hypothetical protein
MNNKFDELAKGVAQSVTRRQALKRFGYGLAGMALACLGTANRACAQTGCLPIGYPCKSSGDCCSGHCEGGAASKDGFPKYKACVSKP